MRRRAGNSGQSEITKDVFMYLDPPYLPGTRKGYLYKYEMDRQGHESLLESIINHPGKILISGYENELYEKYLTGWRKAKKETNAENGLRRTEVLWMNYNPDVQMDFGDFPEVLP